MTDGIHISREVAEAEGVPDELDAGLVGPYRFPDPRRRKISGYIYLVGVASTVWAGIVVDPGYLVVAAVPAVLAVWHFVSAWGLEIDQEDALTLAAAAAPFAVGHASAAITFSGVRARPRWQVIVYSPEEPPARRALVQIDAVSGEVLDGAYVEDVPEI